MRTTVKTCHWQDCNKDTGYKIVQCENEATHAVRIGGYNAPDFLCPTHRDKAVTIQREVAERYGSARPLLIERLAEHD